MADNILQQIKQFIDFVREHPGPVKVYEESTKMFDQFMTDDNFKKKFIPHIERWIEMVKSKCSVSVEDDHKLTFSLFSVYLRWEVEDPELGNIPLMGGFTFNSGPSMLISPNGAWRDSYQDYIKYENPDQSARDLVERLTWFESPSFPGRAPLTHYYGCVLPNGTTFPNEFYFYDGGVVYALPFKTYAEYIQALLASAGVDCWQYFYIDPKIIVEANKGSNYITTQLRVGTRFVEDISIYEYNPSYTFDRLDLILEYLNRVARVFPMAFPDMDFSRQAGHVDALAALV